MADSSSGVTTQGSRTYFFGTSSGLNTAALVEAAYKQRTAEADKIDVKISSNSKKIEAYNTLNTLSKSVQTSLAALKKNFGFSGATSTSVFNARTGSFSTSNDTDPTKLLGVSIDPGTALGSYEIEVVQKAKAHRIASNSAASVTNPLGYTGSFDLGVAGGSASTVNVTSGMSLTDIAAAINGTTSSSGVSATVLKTSDTFYQLVISANATAKNITIGNITGTNVLANIGVTTGTTTPKNVLQTADQAILKLDGVQVTRNSNEITDLISGVNLSIKNAEPGTLIDLDIANDTSSLKNAILSFTEAYNSLRDFVIENQTVSNTGQVSDDAILFGDNVMKMLNDTIQPLISGKYNTGTGLSSLRELGITLDPTNRFEVNDTTLDAALLNNYADVKAIFETSFTSNNSNLTVLSNTSKQQSMAFTMSITANGSGVTGVSVGGDTTLFNISGNSIIGKVGTAYEGITFAYVGDVNATVDFSMNQGIANLMSNAINRYTDGVEGTIQAAKLDLGDQNVDMAARADRVRERAEDYREKLIDRYAAYEAAIAKSKSVIDQLRAILGLDKKE